MPRSNDDQLCEDYMRPLDRHVSRLICGTAIALSTLAAYAQSDADCRQLPSHAELKAALIAATGTPPGGNGGFNLHMWGTIVNRDGVVCAVAFTGTDRGSEWPGSRVISAQKANTANSFSLPGLALSTANLWAAVQPGGSLYGLQHSNPVDTGVAYKGPSANFGQPNDPMVGKKIGGVNVFGGGLALYRGPATARTLVGAIGVSGDTSCADHNIAWRTRNNLALDFVPGGVGLAGRPRQHQLSRPGSSTESAGRFLASGLCNRRSGWRIGD